MVSVRHDGVNDVAHDSMSIASREAAAAPLCIGAAFTFPSHTLNYSDKLPTDAYGMPEEQSGLKGALAHSIPVLLRFSSLTRITSELLCEAQQTAR
jgi:hypothetical protein